MCNAGSPPYCQGFLISRQSIKVSMKKKKEEKKSLEEDGRGDGLMYFCKGACALASWARDTCGSVGIWLLRHTCT